MARMRQFAGILGFGGSLAGAFAAGTVWRSAEARPVVTEVAAAPPPTVRTPPPTAIRIVEPLPVVPTVEMVSFRSPEPLPPAAPVIPEIMPVAPDPNPVAPLSPVLPPTHPEPKTREPAPPVRPDVPKLYVRSLNVVFDYEVAKKGASGVREAQLWVRSKANGEKWAKFATAAAGEPLRAKLPGDNDYAARVVLMSGAGVVSDPLKTTDADPQLVVVVDTVKPTVRLAFSADEATGFRFTAFAADDHLDPAAARLEWRDAADPKGAWSPLPFDKNPPPDAVQPADNPEHVFVWVWQPGPKVPAKVVVRVTVADRAGNTAEATTTEPVATDLVHPVGRLTGVRADEPPSPTVVPDIKPLK